MPELTARKTRILFHYTHKQTLGHTTRVLSLASAIMAKKADLLILQGGVDQPQIEHRRGYRLLNIPFPFDSKVSFRSHTTAQRTEERAAFILKAAKAFAPRVFMTEFFPFGRAAYMPELLPTLRYLRTTSCRIIASIGYPSISDLLRLQNKKFAAMYHALLSLYDTFLIHTPNSLETRYFRDSIKPKKIAALYEATLQSIKNKTIYTGYIFPEQILKQQPPPSLADLAPAQHTVVVSRGGGAVYPKLIVTAIRAQKELGKKFRTIIACGPSTTDKEMVFFKDCQTRYGKDGVFLAHHLTGLSELLRTCQVSVSLSGYNTSVQLMRYGTPSVIVPYQNSLSGMATNDQISRARLLKEKFGSIILSHDTITPKSLANAIRKRAEQPRPAPAPLSWFNGAEISAKIIIKDA